MRSGRNGSRSETKRSSAAAAVGYDLEANFPFGAGLMEQTFLI